MSKSDQANKFSRLHVKGKPLLLYNAWDVGSAKAIVQAGTKAVATSSWAVAAALGYEDGERVPRTLVEELAAGIVEAVNVPVAVDFEGGYSENDDELAKNVSRLLHLGVVGINFEDRVVNGSGLYTVNRQAKRIAAIRRAAGQKGVELFINARTDLFLGSKKDPAKSVDEAIERAKFYADAGAFGFFIPGLQQESLIGRICEEVSLPVNVMYMEGVPANDRLAHLGVARVSYGNLPYVRAMEAIQKEAEKLLRRVGPHAQASTLAQRPQIFLN
ncbi:isocitrate lyase/PEP mutase family protein [Bradyrhizobium genosp. P]|uniref:isocitrate lyase/PEP mutase family protein n=1 Tax=Bradyrhizobium genosp. P TaxID=83641 RepID=UPI003CF133AA